MTFIRLGKFLLLICSLTSASLQSMPNFDLYQDSSNAINLNCILFSDLVKLEPLNYPQENNVFFQLRRPCKIKSFAISNTKKLLSAPGFDVKKKTVVFIHGWTVRIDDPSITEFAKSYFCRKKENLIVVNPSTYLQTEYINAAYNTQELGKIVARGLVNMGIPGKKIHLIGHSLGAQVMGMAARTFAAATKDKIGRLTGLDPARPCFFGNPVFSRLQSTDAAFVDVIHTNPTEAGTEESIGQADFFAGGLNPTQVGCQSVDILCSHRLSLAYYEETVYPGNSRNFIGKKCKTYSQLKGGVCKGAKAIMGYAANPKAKGIYILSVNKTSPYGNNVQNYVNVNSKRCGICTV